MTFEIDEQCGYAFRPIPKGKEFIGTRMSLAKFLSAVEATTFLSSDGIISDILVNGCLTNLEHKRWMEFNSFSATDIPAKMIDFSTLMEWTTWGKNIEIVWCNK